MLAVFQFLEHGGRGRLAKIMGQVMITADGVADLTQAGGHDIEDTAGRFQRHFLVESRDPDAIGIGQFAVIRHDPAINQLEQRRFAGAVAAHQRDPFALVQGEADAVQQGMAVAEVDVVEGDESHAD